MTSKASISADQDSGPQTKKPAISSEARIRASQINGSKSKGPILTEGKERSRANALKHGLTGAGIVMLKADAAEVERRFLSYIEEFDASSDVEIAFARRAATLPSNQLLGKSLWAKPRGFGQAMNGGGWRYINSIIMAYL